MSDLINELNTDLKLISEKISKYQVALNDIDSLSDDKIQELRSECDQMIGIVNQNRTKDKSNCTQIILSLIHI